MGSVIGLAIVVALGAWFLLFRPSGDTAVASPSASPMVLASPSPVATETTPPTAEPTDQSTPAPTPFKAPTFTGMTLDQAQAVAKTGGLELDVRFDATTSKPDGTVLSQAPPPGSSVLPGDQVFLLVAKPGPTVLVPDLHGVAEADAVNQMLDADLKPGTRSEAFDSSVAVGALLGTDPAAGVEVDRGSAVAYVVSLGVAPSATPGPTPVPTAATVAIPDIRGMDEATGFNTLLDTDLLPGVRTEAFDPDIAAGDVISTDPAAGVVVERGTEIAYVVSLGVEPSPSPEPTVEPTTEPTAEPTPSPTPAPVAVPDLAGAVEADALSQLLDAGLQPGTRTEAFDAAVPTGAVIGSDPAAGTEVEPGTSVDYVVSLGVEPTPTPSPTPAPVAVPDLAGAVEADALSQLLDAGLQPGTRTEAFDAAVPTGAVIGSDPAAGTEVEPGTSVDYVVSLGVEPTPTPSPTPAPVAVPDLAGAVEADALSQLLDAGLQPGTRTEAFDAAVPTGAVIGSDPAAGTEVEPGTSVDYVVSLGVEPTPTPSPTPAPVAVPDLAGAVEADALSQLLDAGLQPGTRTEAFDAAVPTGAVIGSDPAAGTEVEPGTSVDYVVSLGVEPTPTPSPTPAPVAVPDLAGAVEADALSQLLDAGLQPGTRTEAFDAAVPTGAVIGSDPAAGTEVEPGTSVDYVVSLGVEPTPTPSPTPAPVAVPDLAGAVEADALSQLLDAGLQPGTRTEAFDAAVPTGAVIGSDPAAGTEVEPGTSVDYVVSLGVEPTPTPSPTPAPVAVPDLAGAVEADALSQLLDAGLQPGTRTEAFDAAVPTGAVIGSDPAAGTEVEPGTSVDYVVSLGVEPTPTPSPTPAPVAVPDLAGAVEADALSQLLDAGLQPGTRTEAFDAAVPTGAVIGSDPAAGTEVEPGTSVDYVVSLGVEPTPTPSPTPAPVAVPDLAGAVEADALSQLLDAGLQPGTRTEAFDAAVPTGAVIGSDPAAGTEVEPGTSVDYVVSLGVEPTPTPSPTPAPVAVPDLAGAVEADALSQLLDAGLQPGTRTEAFDAAVPTGAVIGSDPAAGTEVEPGTSVDYVVSLGVEPTPTPSPTPAPVAVPDLAGAVEADALSQLLDAGLQPGTRTEAFDAACPRARSSAATRRRAPRSSPARASTTSSPWASSRPPPRHPPRHRSRCPTWPARSRPTPEPAARCRPPAGHPDRGLRCRRAHGRGHRQRPGGGHRGRARHERRLRRLPGRRADPHPVTHPGTGRGARPGRRGRGRRPEPAARCRPPAGHPDRGLRCRRAHGRGHRQRPGGGHRGRARHERRLRRLPGRRADPHPVTHPGTGRGARPGRRGRGRRPEPAARCRPPAGHPDRGLRCRRAHGRGHRQRPGGGHRGRARHERRLRRLPGRRADPHPVTHPGTGRGARPAWLHAGRCGQRHPGRRPPARRTDRQVQCPGP